MWDPFKPKDSIWYCWRLNGAGAYLRKDGEIWRIAFNIIPFYERNHDFRGPDAEEPPESLPVTRTWGPGEEVSLHPYLSAEPYILRVREKVAIAPGQSAYFTAVLPPVVRFESAPETVLAETMPITLPKTWFGPDTMNGEFGHSLTGGILPHNAGQETPPSLFIHGKILIKNSAKTMFELEHFVVYPEPLNIYVYKDRLISDTLELDFFGTDQKTTVGQPKEGDYRLISPGIKSGVGETIARRSVDIIKNITRF
ncbi:MAG: hypothetical protein LBD55_10970 [Treponema sp.]|jgi:hypothetical protein|nr:hypothetical protein [Treponema sp.]